MPISKYHPVTVECSPTSTAPKRVLTPPLTLPVTTTLRHPDHFDDWYNETTEWLDLVGLDSARVLEGDVVDAHISRYEVPNPEESSTSNLRVLQWTGLLSSEWCTQLLIACVYVSPGQGPHLLFPIKPWESPESHSFVVD